MGLGVLITSSIRGKSLGDNQFVAREIKRVFGNVEFKQEKLAATGGSGLFNALRNLLGATSVGPTAGAILVAHPSIGSCTLEIQFSDIPNVMEVLITLYGTTSDADPKIDELCRTTGWVRSYV